LEDALKDVVHQYNLDKEIYENNLNGKLKFIEELDHLMKEKEDRHEKVVQLRDKELESISDELKHEKATREDISRKNDESIIKNIKTESEKDRCILLLENELGELKKELESTKRTNELDNENYEQLIDKLKNQLLEISLGKDELDGFILIFYNFLY
jgi:hypothetical protein